MNLRHLQFFVALARERHHGRAAASCNVTQSTLSEAISQLEHEFSVALINRRGQRFAGLTPEGDRVLQWALRIVADQETLALELTEMREGLAGSLRLGAIPAAMPVTPLIARALKRDYPRMSVQTLSRTSIEIQRELDSGQLDAGLTYLENEPLTDVRPLHLYRERYVLLTPSRGPLKGRSSATWQEAADLRLCLLTGDMQNRRILNRLFEEGGAGRLRVEVETNSFLTIIAHIRLGEWSSVVPHTFLTLLGHRGALVNGVRAIPLKKPEATQAVGIVVSNRDPLPSLAGALVKTIRKMDVERELKKLIPAPADKR
jgi:DNA-binding transcriptional LysR family regulator